MIARRASAVALVVTAAVASAGCSGSSAPRPTTSTPPVVVTTTPGNAAAELQQRATLAARLSFAAGYRAHLRSPASTATWRVWRSRTALRVDVVAKRVVATLIITTKGSFSCRLGRSGRTCLRVARAGAPIPAPFDYAPHAVFSTDVDQLAGTTTGYDVRAAGTRPASGGVPASSCFALKAGPSAAAPRVPTGTYCFSAQGLITAITYPSGDTVRLTQASLGTPPATRFVPYATPTPV